MTPMRILVVGQTPPPYGGQTVMVQLFLEGTYRDIELGHTQTNFSKELKSTGKFKLVKIWEMCRVIAAIYWARLRWRPEILYYPPAGPSFIAVMRDIVVVGMTRWLFRKTVFHMHAGGISEYSLQMNPLLRSIFRCALARPDLVIRTSSLAAEDGKGLCSRAEVVVANGIPDAAGDSIQRILEPGEPIRILLVALLREDKGVLVAIDAVQQLIAAGMDVELTCIGEWDSLHVKARAESMIDPKDTSRFKFPGVQAGSEKWEYYRRADIFLFPSYFHSETFGIVLLEAMCFSLPIVATRWRGIPEVVEESSCAILCEPREVEGCRAALTALVSDSALRDRMGRKSRERYLSHFTIDIHRKALESALLQLRG